MGSGGFTIVEVSDMARIDPLARLFNDYRVFYEQPSNLTSVKSFLEKRLQRKESIVFLALGEEDQPLGFTQLYPSFSSVSMKRLWILNDLYVDPKARRRNVGRALIDRARQLAIDTGAKGLILETGIDNVAAQALYDSYGFEKDTEFYHYTLNV